MKLLTALLLGVMCANSATITLWLEGGSQTAGRSESYLGDTFTYSGTNVTFDVESGTPTRVNTGTITVDAGEIAPSAQDSHHSIVFPFGGPDLSLLINNRTIEGPQVGLGLSALYLSDLPNFRTLQFFGPTSDSITQPGPLANYFYLGDGKYIRFQLVRSETFDLFDGQSITQPVYTDVYLLETPEPSTFGYLAMGLVVLLWYYRNRWAAF